MIFRDFNRFFTGKYLKYWYAALFVVIAWIVIVTFNNRNVNKFEVTIYNSNGEVVEKRIIDRYNWVSPEKLPVTKTYRPIKPL